LALSVEVLLPLTGRQEVTGVAEVEEMDNIAARVAISLEAEAVEADRQHLLKVAEVEDLGEAEEEEETLRLLDENLSKEGIKDNVLIEKSYLLFGNNTFS